MMRFCFHYLASTLRKIKCLGNNEIRSNLIEKISHEKSRGCLQGTQTRKKKASNDQMRLKREIVNAVKKEINRRRKT